MKVKFCGLFRKQDIDYANALLPDFVGFIFVKNSKRFVDFRIAKNLKARLDLNIKAVGVFVDSPVKCICEVVSNDIIDIVQLHGSEDNDYVSTLRENLQKHCGKVTPIIKAVKMWDSNSLQESLGLNADFILLDSANAGSGVAFDWNLLTQKLQSQNVESQSLQARDLSSMKSMDLQSQDVDFKDFKCDFGARFFLAGGINADNITQAIALNPYCIDISSGIESQGIKDFAKMQQIITTVREYKKHKAIFQK